MSRKLLLLCVAVCLLLAAGSVSAATYFVPEDRELIQRSDDIVVATGVTSLVERNEHGAIVTRYTLRVEESLKGDYEAGDHLVVTELGGQLGDIIYYVPGAPEYQPGQRYLVFTETNRDYEPVTYGMSLGRFELIEGRNRSFAIRSEIVGFDTNLETYNDRTRDAAAFIEYIRGIVAQTIDPEPHYFVERPREIESNAVKFRIESQFTRNSYLMQASGGRGFRWQNPTAAYITTGTAPGTVDGIAGVNVAMGQWNGTASNINYSRSGNDNTLTNPILCGACDDNKNSIYLTDIANEVSGSVAGIGGVKADIQYSVGGEDFVRVTEGDLVMNETVTNQSCYNTVMTHEMGHTLGFRHSDTPPAGGDSSNDAIMRSSVVCSWNGILKQYDKDAAATVYGAGPVCTNPAITTHPASKSISEGTSTSLTVVATGTSLTYQWYIGNSGNTGSPINGATGATVNNLSPTTTTSYWVRVSGQCGTPVDSNTATITVTPFVCPQVTITSATASPQTNGNFRLSVSATSTGQALTYEWYQGTTPGTGGNLIGNAANVNVSGSVAGSYWARVRNSCGNSAVSAVVTVTPCKAVITREPQNQTIQSGGNATLSVDFAGSGVTVRWYRATAPDKSNSVGTGPTLQVGPLTQTTQYWANLSNSCGETATRTVTISVTGSCSAPVITTEPLDQTVAAGGSATLTVAFTGDGTTVKWYQGAAPDKTTEVGTGPSIVVGPVAVSTQYWANLTNSCGSVESRTVSVNVTECQAPTVTLEGPAQKKILAGQTVTLTVSAGGTAPLHYQWFQGPLGDISKPVGTDSATFTSAPLTKSTSFWVRIRNDCGEVTKLMANVEVNKGRRRAVR